MPKVNPQNIETSMSTHEETIKAGLPAMVIGTAPVFIAGANRKLNAGNFETIDIFAGLSIPMPEAIGADIESLKKIVEDTAEAAFAMVSKEVSERYEKLASLRGRERTT